VTSFALSAVSLSALTSPRDDAEWAALFERPGLRGVTVRGAGASYSDAALNSGGVVALTDAGRRVGPLDERTGIVEVDAGAGMADLLTVSVPRGWTAPVLPGTARLTLGGALAADVHGKNHPAASSLSAHVLDVVLLSPAGGVHTVGPSQDPDAFWATVGGLGLTGVIRRLRLQLAPVTSSWLITRDTAAPDLDTVLQLMEEAGPRNDVTVAWLDGHATGAATGRGVVTTADHLDVAELPARVAERPLLYRPGTHPHLPAAGGADLVRPALIRAANAVRHGRARRSAGARILSMAQVFHQLDSVHGWPQLYGRRGFVQYQFVVPDTHTHLLATALRALRTAGSPPALVVLKRLGAGTPGHLSFPVSGWTLALDLPTGAAVAARDALDRLDEQVAAAGGRVYLVKDSRMHHDLVEQMYPRLSEWRKVRDRLDPDGLMTSDLDRRLRLSGRTV
jgi:decaprenylphospho-beta-D-ribofuranose 2-oxidase